MAPAPTPAKNKGVGSFRPWPHAVDMVAVVKLFRDVLDGRMDAEGASVRLAERVRIAPFPNGFYHAREGALFVTS